MYRFFVQPQVDQRQKSIFGYELLLRKESHGHWAVPEKFTELPLDKQAHLLEELATQLATKATNQVLALNLNREQAEDDLMIGTIIYLKKRLNPAALTIELTESATLAEIQKYSMLFHQYGIKLSIDDVGTGSNTYDNIKNALPFVDQIKFAMQNLRMSGKANQIPTALAFWNTIAQEHHLDLILEGVEDEQDQQMAQQLGIDLHQGYYYGKPQLAVKHARSLACRASEDR
ncbi:EAL domain-containing protein [Lactiplantibacillus mudanjiangensis]|uniref:EAL domain-containing protein [Lactobacillus sp.] n=1 Tax=Lactiplantibacillus mudanjiangensis TaxID=1296538 RepID=A0A660EAV2_9LACO|nr:EAL domain-containing protein [Lactiplantibacillus mudanjiangensis]VDG20148.1 EAL domain-containing protein [Lactobacillus sp.] [Lactiplantibacillus mudanjiangensis]VDG23845.1 EAL domain-containing protein [Lactobacillus sp.] [Lactiplantibacillus mudanjiangensis]VDG30337.1 EAL domain-containing protein [Lactobacillus sp.] [Lactiplantibacillus mudanjiangensis]VDG33543.1 EAL domain-containing protein [Lactobacillus sp.] [Lactiplantibacillus mudanjiangensis]